MGEQSGGEFLAAKYQEMHTSREVERAVERKKQTEGIKTPNQPAEKIDVYLDRLESILNNPDEDKKERAMEIFKERFVYPKVLIDKNNVPENYFNLQKRISKERGYGDVLMTNRMKREMSETVYDDQKKSLDVWIDYLAGKDNDYPAWFKYFALRSVTKMGNYDKEKHEFSRRTKNNTNIFPYLDREALSYTYDVLENYYLKHEKHDDEELNRILESAKFDKIYAFAIDKVTPASKENKEKVEGEWVKFYQGDDATPLYESLQGHGTGWCTAGEVTARSQLKGGDFYVYYTKDENNKNTIPRIAIRMENGQVAEVRGIDPNQNLEGNMTDIASEKYRQLPGGEKFDKKDHDMKFLTLIDEKVKNNEELTKEDLRFLYGVDSKIEGFGYKEDPRVGRIIDKRGNIEDDLAVATGYSKDQISLDKDDALRGGIKFHYGDLYFFGLPSAGGLKLPESMSGNLVLSNLISIEGLKLPEKVGGYVDLRELNQREKEFLKQKYPDLRII